MRLKKPDFIIGIDPDVDKSGVSFLDTEIKKLNLYSLTLSELIVYLKSIKAKSEELNKNIIIVVEGGWSNTRTHRRSRFDNFGTASKKGYNVGRNHQRGMDIYQIAEHIGLKVTEQLPLKKIWKGREGKITHDEMANILKRKGMEFKKRSNQEERDSLLICLLHARIL